MHGSGHHLTALERAEALCQKRGVQLTPLRRDVLRLVLEAEAPIGAYALLDQLKGSRAKAAPPTVYRALDFLLEQGLIHRLERLNAFMGCAEALEGHAHDHDHDHAHSGLGLSQPDQKARRYILWRHARPPSRSCARGGPGRRVRLGRDLGKLARCRGRTPFALA